MKSIETVLFFLGLMKIVAGIVNPNNDTARTVIYLQKPNEMGPHTWLAGISCLDRFAAIYFNKRQKLTRSPNMVLGNVANMSTPSAQIQEGFLKLMMEAISETPPKKFLYQLRIVADGPQYPSVPTPERDLLLADFYVIVVDSVERLKKFLRHYISRMSFWNPGARFLILYNNAGNRNNATATARIIFEEMQLNFYIHFVALMYATSSTKYSLLLLDYFSESSCRQLGVKSLGTCDKGNFTPGNELFLGLQVKNFLSSINLRNCTFYMCAAISSPFVGPDCVHGLELDIMGFIRRHLKCDIKQRCEFESRGIEESPGNWSGLLGRLNERACDFIVGGFYPDNDLITRFWVSHTYLEDSYTWFVKLADVRPPWMAVYTIFGPWTWLSCVAVLLLTWLTWYMLVNVLPEPLASREFSLVGINNMAVTICVAVNERPKCGVTRFFFVILALYGLVLASLYTSKLIAVLSDPGLLHQLHNLREVKEAGIPYGGHAENRDWFENEEDMWIFKDYNDTEDFVPSPDTLEYVERGERVILSSRMYVLQNPWVDHVYAFPENVFSSPLQMVMKPGFPFLYDFDWLLLHMRDTGIQMKIQSDFIYKHTYLTSIAKRSSNFQAEIVLTPNHLQGLFAILIIGITISAIFFCGELLTFYVIKSCWRSRESKLANAGQTSGPHSPKEKKKRHRKGPRRRERKANAKSAAGSTDAPIIAWSEGNNLQQFAVQRGIRFTPLKRRIVNVNKIE